MKKIFTILVIIISVLAARDGSAIIQSQPRSEKLELNNGAKWKVDKITKNNIDNLKAIVRRFAGEKDRSLKALHKAGNDMHTGLDKMIRACKMKGPDHLALHKWLEPLMDQVEELKRSANVVTANKLFGAVILQLDRFDKYFQE